MWSPRRIRSHLLRHFLGIRASLVAFAVFSSFPVVADQPDFCEDLSYHSRSTRTLKDMTGEATNLEASPLEENFSKLLIKVGKRYLPNLYRKEFRNEEVSGLLLTLVFQAQGTLKESDECQSTYEEFAASGEVGLRKKMPRACAELIADFISNETYRRLLGYVRVSWGSERDIEEADALSALMDFPEVQKITRRVLLGLGEALATPSIRRRLYQSNDADEIGEFQSKETPILERLRSKDTPIFERIRILFEAKFQSHFASAPAVYQNLMDRLKVVSWGDFDCSEVNPRELKRALSFNFYLRSKVLEKKSRGEEKVYFCPGSLRRNQSEFSWVWFLAHEIAHVIGPCRSEFFPAQPNLERCFPRNVTRWDMLEAHPYGSALTCLAGPNSAHADAVSKGRSDAGYNSMGIFSGTSSPFCETAIHRGVGKNTEVSRVGYDQIDEAFSDWMATEILNDYITTYIFPNPETLTTEQRRELRKGLSNIFRGYDAFVNPTPEGLGETPSSVSVETRVNRILFAHPELRKMAGCPELPVWRPDSGGTSTAYCSFRYSYKNGLSPKPNANRACGEPKN